MASSEKKTILFVDDEENILRSLRRLFHREGYTILLAQGGHKGLDILSQHAVDLVVSDVRMPEMDGVEFLRQVRQLYPDTACMILSGYAEKNAIAHIFTETTIQEMVSKPWNDDELKQTVRHILSQNNARREFSPGLHRLVNSLEALPPLPQTYRAVQKALSSADDTSAERAAEAIGQNPPIAARLLQVANSTFFGQHREVETINRAIFVLGLDLVQMLVLAASAFQQLTALASPAHASDQLWQHSLACGTIARHIAKTQNADRTAQEMALFTGTMHDLGKLVLIRSAAARYNAVLERAAQRATPIDELEREVLGTDHAELGGYVSECWNLPPSICEAVRYHHQPADAAIAAQLVYRIHLADVLAHRIDMGSNATAPPPASDPHTGDVLQLKAGDIDRLATQVQTLLSPPRSKG